ncbi:MAG: alpha-ketoglutarate-dependent dioxygenase AlkB [Wenzhouxiangellaceae bacterium]
MMSGRLDWSLPPAGRLALEADWLTPGRAEALLAHLLESVAWEQRRIRLFGREHVQPRRIAFMGDRGVVYGYSGDRFAADGWDPVVAELRDRLQVALGVEFNCCLLNLYRDGSDSMGWHADDEPELGPNPTIASVSLGATRRFRLRSRDGQADAVALDLAHGSLLVMSGDIQHHWQHRLARTARAVGPRINLTFRQVVVPTRRR